MCLRGLKKRVKRKFNRIFGEGAKKPDDIK